MSLLPVAEAQERLLSSTRAITETETVPLTQAGGRMLAGDLVARMTQPPFNASAMDGYALRSADAPEPGAVLTVIGTSSAGHGFGRSVGPGQAVRIFTGAPVPDGADAVLIQEDAERREDGSLVTKFPVTLGRHIRPRGQDFAEGEAVLTDGTRLDFGRLTLAAATNHAELTAYRRPRVAILATGDELVSPGGAPGPDQIIGSNSFGIATLARDCGADIIDLGIVGDDRALIAAQVERARAARADILVTLGGASVGDHDLVQETLKSVGMVLDFWRIAMRPGKPLMVGSLDDMHVLGLPGNPVSSMVCALLFLEPMLLKMTRQPTLSRVSEAVTGIDLPANDKRQDYLRAQLSRAPDGRLVVTSFGKQDSSMMKIFAGSDCLIIRPAEAPALKKGQPCPILLLRPFEG
ncbi:gephyrin-like molybdotransferase Glp [Rhizobium sp. RU36D]|uniref:molybdopterin molybdotransferase MoeA n=1 Tax=Rhizobium sp. RU36D TaxID=1907415 RepID=UPI0009D90AA0|nr:gephyrin-like molybdotransferase Glp [Rhizobium sp. RU36D]SMC68596.1 molybdopterin molybdochelatase [Rhizobium sp. RU36D]